jgi:beta-galactosidase
MQANLAASPLFFRALAALGGLLMAAQLHGASPSPRPVYDFNADWRFVRSDAEEAVRPSYDDTAWSTVGLPHTYNDADTFDEIITRSGERSLYQGVAWYRKRFRLPEGSEGRRVFLEVEGAKSTADFYLNGTAIGYLDNGVSPIGFDLTDLVRHGKEKVLAVRVDNGREWQERETRVAFQWASKDFNPNFGGLSRNLRLHLTSPVFQTLPLYRGLGTTGVYIYAKNFDLAGQTADLVVESQVTNRSGEHQVVVLQAVVIDADGEVRATFRSDEYDMIDGETVRFEATGRLSETNWWSPREPHLYTVMTTLEIDGAAVDTVETVTGFRKTDYRGGTGVGGVFINDEFTWLTGYAQRSTNEWAALGQAQPDWMQDFTARAMRESNANYVRWMHIAPMAAAVRAADRYGIVQMTPGGDKERDVEGRQWEQRMEAMRDTIIYFRNSPSILLWEAGNAGISAERMRAMVELRKQWDPHGGRIMGCRTLHDREAGLETEYFAVMIGQDDGRDNRRTASDQFRAFSWERREMAPFIETEDFRDEGARRFWDNYSPPHFGFKKGPEDTWDYNSETFALAAVRRYEEYLNHRINQEDPMKAKWSGYASIIFSDTNSHGRQYSSEVARVSGKMDAMRLPKEIYHASRVMQATEPDLHIIGHWTYPAGTTKAVHVIANCEEVELLLNGRSLGKRKPRGRFIFTFPEIVWQPGRLEAVGYARGEAVLRQTLETAGPPAALRLTAITAPGGLLADGSDVALVDFEVVDAAGRRCPTDETRVDFSISGPAVWRGGYNSGRPGSTNNLWLYTECGINRVAIRSTREAGEIMLTATREGLPPASISISANPAAIEGGLSSELPRRYAK